MLKNKEKDPLSPNLCRGYCYSFDNRHRGDYADCTLTDIIEDAASARCFAS